MARDWSLVENQFIVAPTRSTPRFSLRNLVATAVIGGSVFGADLLAAENADSMDPLEPTINRPASAAQSIDSAARKWRVFQPLQAIQLPMVTNNSWAQVPIDRFILARLEHAELRPAEPASKSTLLRRVYFDLVGVPPSPETQEAFERDPSPNAFHLVVDRLLASAQYGERWGRHWMDVVRYADTAGDNADYPIPEARKYRDYIIDAFNSDQPYDEFVREQLAGDIIGKDAPTDRRSSALIATGFLALSRRYATAPFEFMHLTIEDAIDTTGRTFLGLTLRCARCHDHKFDPVTKEDYYGLYGLFAGTRFPYAGSEEFLTKGFGRSGFVPLIPESENPALWKEHRARIGVLKAEQSRLTNSMAALPVGDASKVSQETELRAVRRELKQREQWGAPPGIPLAYAVVDDQPVDQYVHIRGEPDAHGPVVRRCAPRFFAGATPLDIPPGRSGRREFADWLVNPRNPLTARVMVNRIWQHHFGKGLVATPSNFGLRGEPAIHPELLDYLAIYFVDHHWSVKAVHRLILHSATWQQASKTDVPAESRAHEIDPGNRLYWRMDRRRLDAESIRDALLLVGGNLDGSRPGNHPFPKFEEWSWTQHNPFKAVYASNHRSVYLMRQRLQRDPFLALFDAPDANVSTDERSHETVPLQALYLMNHPFLRNQAEAWARNPFMQASEPEAKIRQAIRRVWGRAATPQEIELGLRFYDDYVASARIHQRPDPESEAWTSYLTVLLTANEFIYVD